MLYIYIRLSEEILDELLLNVAGELEGTCDSMVDQVYEKEFVHPTTTNTMMSSTCWLVVADWLVSMLRRVSYVVFYFYFYLIELQETEKPILTIINTVSKCPVSTFNWLPNFHLPSELPWVGILFLILNWFWFKALLNCNQINLYKSYCCFECYVEKKSLISLVFGLILNLR